MARKKLSQQERKRREEARKARVRRRTGWTEPQPSEEDSPFDPELKELLASPGEDDPEVIGGNIFEALSNSMLWVNEPEFEDLIFDPKQTTDIFIEAAADQGWTPESLSQLEEEELDDFYFEVVPALIPQLLTPEIRQQLLHGLEQISRRFKQEGEAEQALQAAFMRMFLKGQSEPQLWGVVGLLHAIFRRSLAVGFSLAEVMAELDTMRSADDGIASILEAVQTGSVGQKVRSLLAATPGLRRLAEKEADEILENGLEAVFRGNLYLGVYTQDEVEQATQMMNELLAPAAEAGMSTSEALQNRGPEIVGKIDAYVARLFTPARLDELRKHLDNIIAEKSVDRKWLPFITLLRGYLGEEDAVEYERPFLVRAMFGEVQRAARALIREEEE